MIELARTRHSTRKYTSEKIDGRVLKQLLKTGLLAPSSWGKAPVEFVIIDE